MTDDRLERIRKRAFEIWEREGSQEGRDQDHWIKAKEEIEAEDIGKSEPPAEPAPNKKTRKKRS